MTDERELEKLLERFSPKPAPPGLRGRVLRAAEREAISRRILTPAWRWTLVSSLALLAFFALADWRAAVAERDRLASLLNHGATSLISPEKAADKKAAELLAVLPDLDATTRQLLRKTFLNEERAAALSRSSAQRLTEGIHEY